MPPEGGRLRLGGLELGEQDHVVERQRERGVAHLAEGDLGSAGCRALGSHRRKGAGAGSRWRGLPVGGLAAPRRGTPAVGDGSTIGTPCSKRGGFPCW